MQRSCERRLGRHCSTARCQRHSCGAIFGQVSSSIASTQLKWPARVLLPLARLRPIHGGHFADYPQPFLKVHRRLLFSVKPPWYCRLQSAAFFLPLTAIDSRGELLSCPGCFSQAAQRRLTRCVQTVQFSSPNSCSNLGKCLPGSTKRINPIGCSLQLQSITTYPRGPRWGLLLVASPTWLGTAGTFVAASIRLQAMSAQSQSCRTS